MAFPTLTRKPKSVSHDKEPNLLSTDFEAGYEQRRRKFTRDRRIIKVTYDMMDTTDRDAIMTHYDTVGMYTSFDFTDNEGDTYTVYYDKPPSYQRVVPGWFQFETLEFKEK